MAGDTDGGTAVGDTGGEGVHRGGLVVAGETLVVVLAVDGHVLEVTLLKLLDGVLDGGHTLAGRAHGLGREVRVAAGTVPVALEGLGVERGADTPLLTDTEEEETGHPEVVTELDTLTRADLELPLRRHNLGVDARDLDTGVETGAVVGLDEVTGKDLAGTDTTVVGALGTGETVLGPAVDLAVVVEESVLLLETEPGLSLLGSVHDLLGVGTVVGLVGGAVVVVALAKNKNVGTATEGVLEDGDRALGNKFSRRNVGGASQPSKLLTRKTSELSPGAWLVEEPSKFHSRRSATDLGASSRVMVLQRRPPSPSTQTSGGSVSMCGWVA